MSLKCIGLLIRTLFHDNLNKQKWYFNITWDNMRWNRVKLDKICDIQVKVVEIKSTGVFNPTEAAKSSSPTPPIENGKMFKRGKGELSSQTNIFERKTLQICLV